MNLIKRQHVLDILARAGMTPEQYIQFIRSAWAVIGVNPGASGAEPSAPKGKR